MNKFLRKSTSGITTIAFLQDIIIRILLCVNYILFLVQHKIICDTIASVYNFDFHNYVNIKKLIRKSCFTKYYHILQSPIAHLVKKVDS